jgi:hypothetical protein
LAKVFGPDGYERTEAEEEKLNIAAASLFGTAAGKAFMDYLRSISIERVSGPNISSDHLRHLEGMRYIVGIISQRTARGHQHHERSSTKARSSSPSASTSGSGPFGT